MDRVTKERIIDLRAGGMKYAAIARLLNIPVTTIKSFAYKYQDQIEARYEVRQGKRCPHCGNPIPATKYRPRRFCSDECRQNYWKAHQSERHRPTCVNITCPVCQKTFRDYPKHGRKYCSHACYIAARYGGSGA